MRGKRRYSDAAARKPAMTMANATAIQMSSVGMKEIMGSARGYAVGYKCWLCYLVFPRPGLVHGRRPVPTKKLTLAMAASETRSVSG